MAAAPKRSALATLQQYLNAHPPAERTAEDSERETQAALAEIWRKREAADATREPSLEAIPRFFLRRQPAAAGPSGAENEGRQAQQRLQGELGELARTRLRAKMVALILEPSELEQLWRLLKLHASAPASPTDERINYDDFSQVAEKMHPRCATCFFCASHFLKFQPDEHGRIPILHYFQWARRKNALMQTRAELSCFDASGDGSLTEREIEQWVESLIPSLPALSELRPEFFPFYRVTAVRK